MIFLMTHITANKYYPLLLIQFIIGCALYILAFVIVKNIISDNQFDEYKFYICILIVIDALFMIYKIKLYRDSQRRFCPIFIDKTVKRSVVNNGLSSEINNIKITHDLSNKNLADGMQIFSTSITDSNNVLTTAPINVPTKDIRNISPPTSSDKEGSEIFVHLTDSDDCDDVDSAQIKPVIIIPSDQSSDPLLTPIIISPTPLLAPSPLIVPTPLITPTPLIATASPSLPIN